MAKTTRSLSGKVVFITGAARGIGRATASALLAEGARVAIGDLDEDLAKRTAKELGTDVFAIGLDVTDHAGFTAVLDEVEREVGPIDILINNAGIMPIGNFEDDSFESAYRQFSVNVFAVMHGTREAIKRMKPRGHGHVVNLASMAGVVPTPGAATYSASKHAVVGLCESLYWELRGTGIDLSYVLPSLVKTELASGVKDTRASNSIEPEVVAGEIVKALKRPKLAVYAPASMGRITKVTGLIPRALGNKIMTASGSDHLLLDSQNSAGRKAYEARVAASSPGADKARAGQ
ncbi:MAG TPA: SDR family oxidoreductase [Jatrophihabitans sp.]|jgi:NAD(P)-dependent dehydrogenase (short-subunit alcohol dehydrogenase family)